MALAAQVVAAVEGACLTDAAALALRELLPEAVILRLALPATAELLLVTSSLLVPGHLTLALQRRARTLAGVALARGAPAECDGQQDRQPAWLDLDDTSWPAGATTLAEQVPAPASAAFPLPWLSSASLLPGAAVAGLALPLPLPAPAPSPASPPQQHSSASSLQQQQAAADSATAPPLLPSSCPPAAGALVVGARSSAGITPTLRANAEALASALAPLLGSAAPPVVHRVVTAFLGPHRCECGCRAPTSLRRVHQEAPGQAHTGSSAVAEHGSADKAACGVPTGCDRHSTHARQPPCGISSGPAPVNNTMTRSNIAGAAPATTAATAAAALSAAALSTPCTQRRSSVLEADGLLRSDSVPSESELAESMLAELVAVGSVRSGSLHDSAMSRPSVEAAAAAARRMLGLSCGADKDLVGGGEAGGGEAGGGKDAAGAQHAADDCPAVGAADARQPTQRGAAGGGGASK